MIEVLYDYKGEDTRVVCKDEDQYRSLIRQLDRCDYILGGYKTKDLPQSNSIQFLSDDSEFKTVIMEFSCDDYFKNDNTYHDNQYNYNTIAKEVRAMKLKECIEKLCQQYQCYINGGKLYTKNDIPIEYKIADHVCKFKNDK